MTDTSSDAIPDSPRRARPVSPMTSKLAWLVALGLATMIPNTMISSLVGERQVNEQEAKRAYALVIGSIALFLVLCLVMGLTQRVHRREAKPA